MQERLKQEIRMELQGINQIEEENLQECIDQAIRREGRRQYLPLRRRLSKPNRLSCLCLHLHYFIKKKPLCEILRLRAPPPYSILLGLGK